MQLKSPLFVVIECARRVNSYHGKNYPFGNNCLIFSKMQQMRMVPGRYGIEYLLDVVNVSFLKNGNIQLARNVFALQTSYLYIT